MVVDSYYQLFNLATVTFIRACEADLSLNADKWLFRPLYRSYFMYQIMHVKNLHMHKLL